MVGFNSGSLLGGWMATIDWRLSFLLVPHICSASLLLLIIGREQQLLHQEGS